MTIIFIVPYPLDCAPSQRFRLEQYLEQLQMNGFTYSFHSFYTVSGWRNLYAKGKVLPKLLDLLSGFAKRTIHLVKASKSDLVFLHREAAPIGPPVFEWIIAKVLRKKIIYDFDDAIWLTDRNDESTVQKALRWRTKVGLICKWSYKVSCGNEYLADYARQFNPFVVVNPTAIDTEHIHNPELHPVSQDSDYITIGWTGSHSTLKYLKSQIPVLQKLEEKYHHVRFLVIADHNPELPLKRVIFAPWSKESEAQDLLKMNIGIMPLPDDKWTRGKCGFKALQYMAMNIPCVVSPVGVNSGIVEHAISGFHTTTDNEWLNYLEKLINDSELRNTMGAAGRKKVIECYSVTSNSSLFLSLFE
jgi:glycosyltransferase involved in cell wall biosynthesis